MGMWNSIWRQQLVPKHNRGTEHCGGGSISSSVLLRVRCRGQELGMRLEVGRGWVDESSLYTTSNGDFKL